MRSEHHERHCGGLYRRTFRTLHLRPFKPEEAAIVTGWVQNDRELFWVAPATAPPLTPDKVLAWTRRRGNPYLLLHTPSVDAPPPGPRQPVPIGYAELNPLRQDPRHLWIGHAVLSPAHRGRGLGAAFMRLLLDHAFHEQLAKMVSLMVFPGNEAALRCYLRVGFEIREEQFHTFGDPPRSYRMRHLFHAPPHS